MKKWMILFISILCTMLIFVGCTSKEKENVVENKIQAEENTDLDKEKKEEEDIQDKSQKNTNSDQKTQEKENLQDKPKEAQKAEDSSNTAKKLVEKAPTSSQKKENKTQTTSSTAKQNSEPGPSIDPTPKSEPQPKVEAPSDKVDIVLYFMNEQIVNTGNGNYSDMIREVRTVSKDGRPTEEIIVRELKRGPNVSNAVTALRQDITIKSVTSQNGIAYVDFSSQNLSGSSLEQLGITQQITRSLTELSHINRVQFLVDGAVRESLMGH